MTASISEAAKDGVRRNTEEVQGRGDWALFNELFAEDFFDHTPQAGGTRDKAGVLALYKRLREAFPDFTPEIHWQRVDGDVVTTFKTYHGTHRGNFLGIAGTGTKVSSRPSTQCRSSTVRSPNTGCGKPLLGPAAVGGDRSTAAGLKRWTPMKSLIALNRRFPARRSGERCSSRERTEANRIANVTLRPGYHVTCSIYRGRTRRRGSAASHGYHRFRRGARKRARRPLERPTSTVKNSN
jgi:hypothetical protein